MNNRKKIVVECFNCKTQIKKDESEVKRSKRLNRNIFCNIKCAGIYHSSIVKIKMPNTICAYCKDSFYITNSRKKITVHGLNFCCRGCKDLGQRLDNGVLKINRYSTGVSSYREKVFRVKEKVCEICGFNKYPEILEVHHLDKNRRNNKLENLKVLCPNCHNAIHRELIKI